MGGWRRKGHVDKALLDELSSGSYYRNHPPRTAGREQYGVEYVERLLATGLPAPDLIATATALTAATGALAIERFAPMRVDELIVSGGGARNPRIMDHLAAFLPGVAIAISSDFGIDIDAKEAIAFAILGYQTLRRRLANLPRRASGGARQDHPVALWRERRYSKLALFCTFLFGASGGSPKAPSYCPHLTGWKAPQTARGSRSGRAGREKK
jgi:anhydro-N-acetylmuramic acid kinase